MGHISLGSGTVAMMAQSSQPKTYTRCVWGPRDVVNFNCLLSLAGYLAGLKERALAYKKVGVP